jgi:hypothetical protein
MQFMKKVFTVACIIKLYKTITIVIMTIIIDATVWSVTYDRN